MGNVWYNVKDKLPDSSETMLVVTTDRGAAGRMTTGFYDKFWDCWHNEDNGNHLTVCMWQPLPANPLEQNND